MAIQVKDVTFQSDKHKLKGRIYRPEKDGKYPAVAICHGYPGDTKNMDLAEELAINDIAVLIFYYQGAWGSEGTYKFSNLAPSTVDAVKYLKAQPYVDTERVGLISHSMGALPITKVMAEDKTIKTGVLMSPASNISRWLIPEAMDTILPIFLGMAEGKLAYGSAEEYKANMLEAGKTLNPMDRIADIEAPILVVVGSADTVTVPEDCKALYEKATPPKKWAIIDGADHSYTEHRLILQDKVLEWLKENL